ncbi:MAG: HupE/UreJ family protein, partial [Gammaproteobacteria bacterium]
KEDVLVHYINFDQVRRQPLGLGELAAHGFTFSVEDQALAASVEDVRIHQVGSQPDFATLEEAKLVFDDNQNYPETDDFVYVGEAVVDIVLRYQHDTPVYAYQVSSSLDPSLPEQENTANLILDYSPGKVQVFRERGLLAEPILITRSAFSAFVTFVKEGIRHILEGLDHVLFVICLVLGATQLRNLFWRVTGFTIGHSITLSAGFFGFVPSGAWFVPAVETGIALSIIYVAIIAVVPRFKNRSSEQNFVAVTSAIGLLHGLGFSFVLHNILQITSPDIWQSLLAFNVGVEIGQISIVIVAYLLFLIIKLIDESLWRIGRWSVAVICVSVAFFWTSQRVLLLVSTF